MPRNLDQAVESSGILQATGLWNPVIALAVRTSMSQPPLAGSVGIKSQTFDKWLWPPEGKRAGRLCGKRPRCTVVAA